MCLHFFNLQYSDIFILINCYYLYNIINKISIKRVVKSEYF